VPSQDCGYVLLWQRYDNNKMAAMRYYGNVILHLQQYSHRLNLLCFFYELYISQYIIYLLYIGQYIIYLLYIGQYISQFTYLLSSIIHKVGNFFFFHLPAHVDGSSSEDGISIFIFYFWATNLSYFSFCTN